MTRPKERVMLMVGKGFSNAEIGEVFDVKKVTIEKDLVKIYKELGCASPMRATTRRCEAVLLAVRAGWIK